MKKIGIIVAMEKEAELVKSLIENSKLINFGSFKFIEGKIYGKNVVLGISGIGKVNAALGIYVMISNFSPDCIINTGVAGGLDHSIKVADVVVGTEIVYHDVYCGPSCEYGQVQGFPTYFKVDKDLLKKALSLKMDFNIVPGLISTGDKFITKGRDLDVIKKNFPKTLAVDMESASMAQVCYIYKIPFMSFRIISDTPWENEDNLSQYFDFYKDAPEESFKVIKNLIAII